MLSVGFPSSLGGDEEEQFLEGQSAVEVSF